MTDESVVWTWFSQSDRQRLLRMEATLLRLTNMVNKMAFDVSALTAAVAAEETQEAAVVAALNEVVKELQALRSAAGGATQNEVDAITARIQGVITNLSAPLAAAQAAEEPAPPAPTTTSAPAAPTAPSGT